MYFYCVENTLKVALCVTFNRMTQNIYRKVAICIERCCLTRDRWFITRIRECCIQIVEAIYNARSATLTINACLHEIFLWRHYSQRKWEMKWTICNQYKRLLVPLDYLTFFGQVEWLVVVHTCVCPRTGKMMFIGTGLCPAIGCSNQMMMMTMIWRIVEDK